jgi:mycothiol system anti-sigma-R factor
MDHRQYIEQYLSADVDGELSDAERRAVSAHLANCADCRQRRGAERVLKALIRERITIMPAPPELRKRIAAVLEAKTAGAARKGLMRKPLWMASVAALAAAAAVLVVILVSGIGQPQNPRFDAAVADYLKSEQSFKSSAGLRSVDELAVALANQFGYPYVWDFSSLGMALAGARIDHLAGGKVVAYSLYKGARGSILCINFRALDYVPPPGGQMLRGVRFYRYKDLWVGIVRYGTVFCLLVTRLPPAQMAPALIVGAPNTGSS